LKIMWKEKTCPAIKIMRTDVVNQKLNRIKKKPETPITKADLIIFVYGTSSEREKITMNSNN